MRWVWYIFLIVLGSLSWLTIFAYPSGGSFDWIIKGSSFYKGNVFFPKTKTYFEENSFFPQTSSSLYDVSPNYDVYSLSKGVWEIKDKEGFVISIYESDGIPFFKKDRLFHVMNNNTIIEEIDLNDRIGSSKWKKVLNSSLTSLSMEGGFLALGLSAGEVWILDFEGNVINRLSSYFLEDALILGVSLAFYQEDFYLAFVEGLNYSFLSIYKLEDSNWHLIGKNDLGESLKKEYSIFFREDQSSFFTNYKGGILSFNIESQKFYKFPIKGVLINSFKGSLGGNYILSLEGFKIYLSQIHNSKVLRVWDFYLKDKVSFEWLVEEDKSFLLNKEESYFWVLEKN